MRSPLDLTLVRAIADLDELRLDNAAGLRSLGPVWSRSNQFGHGVPFVFPSSPDTGPGLTEPGVALVRRCGERGIMVDLSHLNEAGFWDVARLKAGPLVATHSGAHALSGCSRNLTDARSIDPRLGRARRDRVGNTSLRDDFADTADTPLELIAAHARYVADRIGVSM